MLIAQISDTHITVPNAEEPHFRDRITALKAFVAHINARDEKPDVIIHTGDVTHGGLPEYYETVRSALDGLAVPIHFALGNRDISENLIAALSDRGGAEQVEGFQIYSVDGFPVRLIAMDTQHRGENMGEVCPVRLRILDDMLAAEPDRPTAVFMHHPPFDVPTSKYPFQFEDREQADAFLGVIARHAQVAQMFCGHMHRDFRVQLDTCQASCVPSLPSDNQLGEFEPEFAGKPLYHMHRWDGGAGRFETTLCAAG